MKFFAGSIKSTYLKYLHNKYLVILPIPAPQSKAILMLGIFFKYLFNTFSLNSISYLLINSKPKSTPLSLFSCFFQNILVSI